MLQAQDHHLLFSVLCLLFQMSIYLLIQMLRSAPSSVFQCSLFLVYEYIYSEMGLDYLLPEIFFICRFLCWGLGYERWLSKESSLNCTGLVLPTIIMICLHSNEHYLSILCFSLYKKGWLMDYIYQFDIFQGLAPNYFSIQVFPIFLMYHHF